MESVYDEGPQYYDEDPWGRRPSDPWYGVPPDQPTGPVPLAPGVTPGDPGSGQFPYWGELPKEPPAESSNNPSEPPKPGGGGGFSHRPFNAPSWDVGQFVAPSPFEYEGYTPLTAETYQADPGYEFRLKEGTRALNNAASAQGLLRTGGTLQELMNYGQGLASQEFGNADARHFRNYQANRSNAADLYDRNWRNQMTDYVMRYNNEADEFDRALATHNTQFGDSANMFGINSAARNQMFGNLLSLYGLATRSLPTYSQGSQSPSYGFNY